MKYHGIIRKQGVWRFRPHTTSVVSDTHYRRDVYIAFGDMSVTEFENWLYRYHREVLGTSRLWHTAEAWLKFWLARGMIYLD